MSISPEENVKHLEVILAQAKRGAGPAATAAARFIAEQTANVTLRISTHPPGAYHRAGPGRPPAYASGNLARSIFYVPAGAGLRVTALVGSSAPYSRILEFGCVVQPTNKKFMHWVDSGGSWYHKFLVVPPHPFVEPTVDEAIDSGDLQDELIIAFKKYDP